MIYKIWDQTIAKDAFLHYLRINFEKCSMWSFSSSWNKEHLKVCQTWRLSGPNCEEKYFQLKLKRTVESVAKLHSLTLNKLWRQIFDLISFPMKQIFNSICFQLKQIFNLISLQLKQRTVESVAKLHSLTLHGNPWACDCHLRPLLNWLQVKYQIF